MLWQLVLTTIFSGSVSTTVLYSFNDHAQCMRAVERVTRSEPAPSGGRLHRIGSCEQVK